MTSKSGNCEGKQQIPSGMTSQKGKCNGKRKSDSKGEVLAEKLCGSRSGFLRCAVRRNANCSGRN